MSPREEISTGLEVDKKKKNKQNVTQAQKEWRSKDRLMDGPAFCNALAPWPADLLFGLPGDRLP